MTPTFEPHGFPFICEKQHNLFILSKVKQCTESPSNIRHAEVYVRAKAKRVEAFKCEVYDKNQRKICFQHFVKYRRADRTV